jgi:hypothetical protein
MNGSKRFTDAMLPRLRASSSEASQLVLYLAQKMPLADAVLDAIESLTTRQTIQLRRWVENWEVFNEWLDLHREGWDIKRHHHFVWLHSPKGDSTFNENYRTSRDEALWPNADIVAAGADVQELKKVQPKEWMPQNCVRWSSEQQRWLRQYFIT